MYILFKPANPNRNNPQSHCGYFVAVNGIQTATYGNWINQAKTFNDYCEATDFLYKSKLTGFNIYKQTNEGVVEKENYISNDFKPNDKFVVEIENIKTYVRTYLNKNQMVENIADAEIFLKKEEAAWASYKYLMGTISDAESRNLRGYIVAISKKHEFVLL